MTKKLERYKTGLQSWKSRAAGPKLECLSKTKWKDTRKLSIFFAVLVIPGPSLAQPLPVPTNPADSRVSTDLAGQSMQVQQSLSREVFDWQQFNIDHGYRVDFNQPSASAIALNRIHQNDPSRIFGELNANGQIYLVNTNGFVFGNGSSVNANTLIATTQNISNSVLERGLTQVFDQDGSAALDRPLDANGNPMPMGDIVVESGASITARERGLIILAAPNVENAGTLSAKDGQVIVAASEGKVYLTQADQDSGVRGLLVEVDVGGEATNLGDILARNGNATMIGFAVNQKGRISATTTVDFNGQIRLLAREGGGPLSIGSQIELRPSTTERTADLGDGLGTRSKVTFGVGSETRIDPDPNGGSAIDGQAQSVSSVQVMGHQIEMERGSAIVVPSGAVEMIATVSPSTGDFDPNKLPSNRDADELRSISAPDEANDTAIILAANTTIDVSGTTDTVLPMERNVISVRLTDNELRDSPLQRGGFLDRQTIRVDVRTGTPIADISAEVAKIQRPLSERLGTGGRISLVSQGSAAIQQGSVLDISGGSVTFQDGFIDTTMLITDDGQVIPIGQADPNLRYTGIYGQVTKTYEKWGQTLTWTIQGMESGGIFEPGYVQGQSAGTLDLIAPRVALDGKILAGSQSGRRQRELGNLAFGGELYLDLARSENGRQGIRLAGQRHSSLNPSLDDFLPDPHDPSQPAPLELDNRLFAQSGLNRVTLIANGQVRIERSSAIRMLPGSQMSIDAGSIDMAGSVDIHSGTLDLATHATSSTPQDGHISLAPSTRIDLSGQWVNNSPVFTQATFEPLAIDGGSFRVSAFGDLTLESGSSIDVSAAARLSETNEFIAGQGGDVFLEAARANGSNLIFESTVRGHSFDQGGTFTLASNEVIVSDSASPGSGGLQPTILSPDFIEHAGFGNYRLISNANGITVDEGTEIRLVQSNREFRMQGSDRAGFISSLPTGSDLNGLVDIIERPRFARNAVNLSLELAQTATRGPAGTAVNVNANAVISSDPGARVALISDGNIHFDGIIDAPAGTVDLTITEPRSVAEPGFIPSQVISLGANSRILAQGAVQAIPDPSGRRDGFVLPGGTVTIDSRRGFVIFERGTLIDVSGTSAQFDLPALDANHTLTFSPRTVASDAGSISFLTSEGAFLDGSLVGHADAAHGAAGGMLTVNIDPRRRGSFDNDQLPVEQRFPIVPAQIRIHAGNSVLLPSGFERGDAIPEAFYGIVEVNRNTLQGKGFESLRLFASERISFDQGTGLAFQDTLILDTPRIQSSAPGASTINLSASFLQIGSSQLDRTSVLTASGGTARLMAKANLIDLIGITALEGFHDVFLNSTGDIRMRGNLIGTTSFDFTGAFSVAGNLCLQANQIYPTTLSDFAINLSGESSTLTVLPGGPDTPVLSAAGRLSLSAPNIVNRGVLKAPLGNIDFNASNRLVLAAGSKVNVSIEDQLIPFGRVQGGLNWVYPLTGNRFVVFDTDPESQFRGPPEKRIRLNGRDIAFEPGASIDADGGGDLYAFEVVRGGPGGSRDVLDPNDPDVVNGLVDYQQQFAILPGFQSVFAPYDPLEFSASGLRPGDSIYLNGVAGLAAGNYVLLPAHYALLPGALLVSPVPGTRDIVAGLALTRIDGAPISAGYRFRAGTDNRESRLSGFAVEAGGIARTRSDFIDYFANRFFADQATRNSREIPRIPVDAGLVSISTIDSLSLGGELQARAASRGRGGQLDIQAENLAIVETTGVSGPGVVEIDANSLNQLDVASLLLGGSRNQTSFGTLFPDEDNPGQHFIGSPVAGTGTVTEIVAISDTVTVASGVALEFAETILVAKDTVKVDSGATLSSANHADRINQVVLVSGESAVVRVTNDAASAFARIGLPQTVSRGSVVIESGARLDSGRNGSILLDAPFSARLDGSLNMNGGSLALSTAAIEIGAGGTNANALVLNNRVLNGLELDALYLNSLSRIDLIGNFEFGNPTLNLELSAAQISGIGSASDVFSIQARTFSLANRFGAEVGVAGGGTGTLKVQAGTLEFAGGAYSVDGFNRIEVSASSAVMGRDNSRVRLAADSTIETPLWSAATNARAQIDASGHALDIRNNASGAPPSTGTPGLGAVLTITAERMDLATNILLPSGRIDLNAAHGDLHIQSGSMLDVHGSFVELGQAFGRPIGFSIPAGDVLLTANDGNILFDAGATINLSNQASNARAGGSLEIRTPRGRFDFAGQLDTRGAGADRFSVEVDGFGANGFSQVASQLSNTRFERIGILQNSGDLLIGSSDSLAAAELTIEASSGSIEVEGTLNVSTQGDGGLLRLISGDRMMLGASSRLLATGTDGRGGRIRLEAWDRDGDGLSGLGIDSASSVDLSGRRERGELIVSVPRIDSNSDGQDDRVQIDGSLAALGQPRITVEAVRVYTDDSIDGTDIAAWRDDTRLFMNQARGALGAGIDLIPGIVVNSAGDLSLDAPWNFLPSANSTDWRYNASVGVLTLRAAGNIRINQSITDGFAPGTLDSDFGSTTIANQLQSGNSWSYRFDAGGDFTLAANRFIRTGTGDIEVEAGGDINYGNQASSIYTAGRRTTQTIAVDPNDPTHDIQGNPLTPEQIANNPYGSFSTAYAEFVFYAEYPVDGGDVSLSAGGDINGVQTDQFITEWLVRTGDWDPSNGITGADVPTAWGIAIDQPQDGEIPSPGFHQSVGALGGGRVTIDAGGDIRDLSVVLPTSGKQIAASGPNADPNAGVFEFADNQVAINGGGALRVSAGRNIEGGLFYVGAGSGFITAGGDITTRDNNLGALLAIDDARIDLLARGDIALSGIFNPTALPQIASRNQNLFFRYGPSSEVEAQSIAGDLVWNSNAIDLERRYDRLRFGQTNDLSPRILPPALRFFAGRDIRIESGITLFPDRNGQLDLIAGRDITSNATSNLVVLESDSDPAFLPNLLRPAITDLDAETRLTAFGRASLIHAAMPLHGLDREPVLIAAGRDISNENENSLTFVLAESSIVSANRDVAETSFRIQNTRADDTALIQAARDIRFSIPLDPRTGGVVNQQFDLEVAGPGRFYALAGRDLDLGASNGIASIGNLANPGLVDGGADITVLAGLGGFPDFTNFTRIYLEEMSEYRDRLIEYIGALTGASSNFSEALSTFKLLSNERRLPLILEIFYHELLEGGRKGAATGMRSDYARGDRAIATLLPDESAYRGDASLFFSKIQTIDGGDINLLIPGGELNAGLAVAFSGRKEPSQLGIVAQQAGDINIYVRDDLQVNSSRVATFGGGDILGWSKLGNIDAGRGARSSVTIPPPITVIDSDGQIVTTFSPAVAVSGIQAATTRDGDQGNVFLFAPNGVIDAGLAGIAGRDVTVGATAILNASNISFSRSSVGVPLGSTTSIAAGLTGASNLATTVGKVADSVTKNISEASNETAQAAGFLKVEFLGYECDTNTGCDDRDN